MKINPEPTIVRMYPNGPFRLFSEEPFLGALPYQATGMRGFAGSYVCALCQQRAHEVIFAAGEWVCKGCSRPSSLQRESRAIERKWFTKDDPGVRVLQRDNPMRGRPRMTSASSAVPIIKPEPLAPWPNGIGPPMKAKPRG